MIFQYPQNSYRGANSKKQGSGYNQNMQNVGYGGNSYYMQNSNMQSSQDDQGRGSNANFNQNYYDQRGYDMNYQNQYFGGRGGSGSRGGANGPSYQGRSQYGQNDDW